MDAPKKRRPAWGAMSRCSGCKRQLFRKKSFANMENETGKSQFKKTLGALEVTMIGIGEIMGSGVLVLTGLVASEMAGKGETFWSICSSYFIISP